MAPIPLPDLDAPWHEDTLLQLRTSKMKPMLNLDITTGIYKQPRTERVFCSSTGLESDEHDLTFHGGVDKAVHQYYPGHYTSWRKEFPHAERLDAFQLGGFGENLVAEKMNERNVCIGDKVRIGEVLLQVCLPRQPCFKLNHRFGLKAFAAQTWKKSRTGWYYRVLEEGSMGVGDRIVLVERPHPRWTIERIQEYFHRDTSRLDKLLELSKIEEFGDEMKGSLKQKIAKCEAEIAVKDKKEPERWEEFTLIDKKRHTPHITSFTFSKPGDGEEFDPGFFVRLKLPSGLIRSYSIVSGDTHKFQLGIKREGTSRGGSRYLHDELKEGDKILVGKMTESVPITSQASNHIFIAGGIGITAFLMHADIYSQINFNYTLHYAVTSEEIPFKPLLEKMGDKVVIYDKSKGQRMDIHGILKNRTWNSFVYACGPQRMIDTIVRSANEVGMSQEDIHFEAFQINTSGDPFTVQVKNSGQKLEVKGEKTLLQVLRDAGLDVDSSCETGNCGTCRVEVCEGKVEHRGSGLGEEDKGKAMLSCVSRGVGHIVIDF
ncbi:related to phthalate 4,5-dioxygenase oxygenase reductase subunit [Phialocephala subalpina]|uniref:Related to phthalate 4,5-dioxygenase oxygenase reductase subunit n=1 Tax=Phialocephala subalpina TaxID=576137 RepID=A0A1L7WKL4_9HELO|nr:related to phthalate 4,5-dioxygenase oxygenase reductase subunit [Phialocephala subalpina]